MTATFNFGQSVYPGQSETIEVDGFEVTASIYADDDADPPWKREDGHGAVSDWRRLDSKLPSERLLSQDHGSARFYEFAEACKIALRDGWGCEGGKQEGETPRAYAARAAEADFERLRQWCADQWSYIGVAVTVSKGDVRLTPQYANALWGIESDCGAYVAEAAGELTEEALTEARATLATLCSA